jgi:hypothetical protein
VEEGGGGQRKRAAVGTVSPVIRLATTRNVKDAELAWAPTGHDFCSPAGGGDDGRGDGIQ